MSAGKVLGSLFLLVGVFLGGAHVGRAAQMSPADPQIEILKAQLAEAILTAETVPETVRTTITRTRAIRDTLNIHDTVQVREFVRQVDTLIQRCEECATGLEATVEAARPVALAPPLACPVPGFKERLGVFGGYGLSAPDGVVRTGWALGVGVRLWP